MKIDKAKLHETAVEENFEEQHLSADIRKNRSLYKASMKIAMKIKRAIRIANMSQLQLAQKMEMDPAALSRCLNGKANMELRTLVKFEEVLGITIIDRSISPYSHCNQQPQPSFHIKFVILASELQKSYNASTNSLLPEAIYNKISVYNKEQQFSDRIFYVSEWS